MIDVYIRLIDEEDGRLLGSFKPSEINDVVSLIKEHGASVDDGDDIFEARYFESRFVVSDEERHFEIICH